MTQHHSRLALEELGARDLPSVTPLLIPPIAGPLAIAPTSQPVTYPLEGNGLGTFTSPVTPNALTIDALTTFNIKGTANLVGMGNVTVTGTVHSVGFVLTCYASGQLTFSNAKGSVTIALTGPLQGGFATLPTTFTFKVVAHTGAYVHLAAQGQLLLAISPQLVNYIPQPQGTFALAI